MSIPSKPVMITGASGALGRLLTRELSAAGWTLRLTDIAPFPDPLPEKASFLRYDLADGVAVMRQAEGVGAILHFGGCSVEQPFEAVIGPNLRGLYHIYEAARREKARVIFASSNHSIGFHKRPEGNEAKLDYDCAFRPDGYYGLSKAYGELMGRMYWDKHGIENVNLRIGSCFPKVVNRRMLSTWLSYPDLVRLCQAAVTAPRAGHAVIWACSNNAATYWGKDHRERIGWQPQDSADGARPEVEGIVSGDPVEERYQGGSYTSIEYSRQGGFSAKDAFDLD
ncbi:NAD(P)-dependent oxidoreductase [Acetobacteraceae bacterium H6797]|nr:NAD(P)-dependent oxidoreductase [Acetobacteraceae bacterium H6797]